MRESQGGEDRNCYRSQDRKFHRHDSDQRLERHVCPRELGIRDMIVIKFGGHAMSAERSAPWLREMAERWKSGERFVVVHGGGPQIFIQKNPTAGIGETNKPVNFRIYPNPTTDHFIIKSDKPYGNFLVTDITGRRVATLRNNELMQEGRHYEYFKANEYRLTTGIYFLCFQSRNYSKQVKIVLIK